MRAALIVLAGCGFHRAVEGGAIDAPPPLDDGAGNDARAIDGPPAASAFCDPTDPTLVACYAFEGVTTDGTAHHHDATTATAVTYASGEVGQGLAIGTSTEVDVADSTDFDVAALTIEAWVSADLTRFATGRGGVLDCDGQYGLFVQKSGVVTCSAGATLSTAAAIAANTWTHVACTHDATSVTIYLDGLVAATTPATPMATASTTGLTLGGNNPPGGGDPLVGTLDQLRLFSIGRTAAQICRDAGKTICP